MKQGCLWLLLFAAWSASAQPVYKCTNAEGGNSYQSTPCAKGEASTTRAHVAPASGYMPTSTATLGAAGASPPAELRTRLDQAVQDACG